MNRRSLQSRIQLLVAVGIVLLFAAMGTASWLSVRASIDRLLHERLMLAQATSEHLERSLQLGLRRLGEEVSEVYDPSDGLAAEKRALLHATSESVFSDSAFLLDAAGRLLLHVPAGTRTVDQRDLGRPLDDALAGRPSVSSVIRLGSSGRRVVCGLEPIRGRDGSVVGVVGGGIDLTGNRLREIITGAARGEGSAQTVEIFDGSGTVLAGNVPTDLLRTLDHRDVIASHIRQRRAAVVACHSCHEDERARRTRRLDVMALAPLESIPWAVAIREERGAVLQPAHELRALLLWLAGIFLAGAAVVAALTVRSVVRPIRILGERVRQIAAGELDVPVPALGDDEIGDLGRHVEVMRARLRASLAGMRSWNTELEAQVKRRTAELSASAEHNAELYQKLQREEEARRRLLHKVIGAQEDERKRVARELHDSTSQELSALLLRIQRCTEGSPELAERLAPVTTLAKDTLDELHRLILDLRPGMLDDLGLAPALRWLIGRLLQGTPVAARFEIAGDERRLPPELETTLFRLAQEAITNVARHAQASQLLCSLSYEARGVTVVVEDDGVGFTPAEVVPTAGSQRGLGLLGMRERVELWDGEVEIDSAPGEGCRVRLYVPYPPYPSKPDPEPKQSKEAAP